MSLVSRLLSSWIYLYKGKNFHQIIVLAAFYIFHVIFFFLLNYKYLLLFLLLLTSCLEWCSNKLNVLFNFLYPYYFYISYYMNTKRGVLISPSVIVNFLISPFQLGQFLLNVFWSSAMKCIHILNCYVFLINWPLCQ